LTQGRISLRNPGAKAQIATTLAPVGDQRRGMLACWAADAIKENYGRDLDSLV
jgi:hypothetical protein